MDLRFENADSLDNWLAANLDYFKTVKDGADWLKKLTAANTIILNENEITLERLAEMAADHFTKKRQDLTGPETYRKIAAALPWEIQSTLLALRDCQDDTAATEELFYKMPTTVYIALQELCLAGPWYEEKRSGLALTSAGKHLAEYCTC